MKSGHGSRPPPGDAASEEAVVARALDRLFVPDPSAALMGRILGAMPQPRIRWRDLFGVAPASAFAASAMLGLWLGAGVVPNAAVAQPDQTDWIAAALGEDLLAAGEAAGDMTARDDERGGGSGG